jgi:hypothetical protein
MTHTLAIEILSQTVRIKQIQHREHALDGRHFVAKRIAEQINELKASISHLETPLALPPKQDPKP